MKEASNFPQSYEEWEALYRSDPISYNEKYKEFMYNKKNCFSCHNCPENRGFDSNFLPCGQHHCWVMLHCDRVDQMMKKGEEND